jgi:NADPH-dependent ferric siderophore reductase
MTSSEPVPASARIRREPPRFRRVTVTGVRRMSPRLVRITFSGAELEGLEIDEPAASVRLLLPASPTADLAMPAWNGNEFLLPDGRRPIIRTLTPGRFDPDTDELDVAVVLHGPGAASEWAASAEPGAPAAVSGPGRGYTIDVDAPGFLVAGDETALPAICQLLEALPATTPVEVHIEIGTADAELTLPGHPHAAVAWWVLPSGATVGDALVAAIQGVELVPGTRVWVAGEAAAVQRIRRHLFEERGLSRSEGTVRGYWKHGRAGAAEAGPTD